MPGKVCVRLSARHKTLSRCAPRGVAGGSVASVTTGADILIINTSSATAVNRLENLIGAWLRLHLRDFASYAALSFASFFLPSFLPFFFLLLSLILIRVWYIAILHPRNCSLHYTLSLLLITARYSFVLFLLNIVKLNIGDT